MTSLEWRVEAVGHAAWPALREIRIGGWRLRLAPGISRRSNSLNPHGPGAGDVDVTIAAAAPYFADNGQPILFRVLTPLLDPGVDRRLAALGYTAEGETATFYGALADLRPDAAPPPEVECLSRPDDAWFAAMSGLQEHGADAAAAYRRVVERVAVPAAFLRLASDGVPVALAFAALQDGLMCCESVITAPAHRGRGNARRLMRALFRWAGENGAEGVCLQVVADNAPALALYRGLGLTTELYRYHYRRAAG
jgi:ribosomal protein S18 acetylase RimI-like enzyme